MAMPESFRTATLFPDAAIRVNRPAEPFIWVVMEEKVSDYEAIKVSDWQYQTTGFMARMVDVRCCQ